MALSPEITGSRPILYQIPYSPWSEKVRWALRVAGTKYVKREFLIMLSDAGIRWKTKNFTGDFTIPLWIESDGSYLCDSFAIVERATQLIPADQREEMAAFHRISEKVLDAGRGLVSLATKASPEAQLEALPPFIPGPFKGISRPLVHLALGQLDKEFGVLSKSADERRKEILAGFNELRSMGLGKGPYVKGNMFSYYDIMAAVCLQFIKPVDQKYIALGEATRKAWTDLELSRELEGLIQWRDGIYDQHRR